MNILVTGGAGFIGSQVVDLLLKSGESVTVLDNFDPFYPESVKRLNIRSHMEHPNYTLIEGDIRDNRVFTETLSGKTFDAIIHLAAKAGVRPSIMDPVGYQKTNVEGTQNLLEYARIHHIKQFVFASSSSVYGVNPNTPWSESDLVLKPISPYASTKVSGELLGHVYSHLYDIRFVGLRFFTVFGPRQRPDLAIHKFLHLMTEGKPITLYGDGSTRRDYTYVGDIVHGILGALHYSGSMYEVVNLGNRNTVSLVEMVGVLEEVSGIRAEKKWAPMQPGDVPITYADVSKAKALWGYEPKTDFKTGIQNLWDWKQSLSKGDG